jgi:hypothetical protein
MAGISLHMQWPLTSQLHGSFLKENNWFFIDESLLNLKNGSSGHILTYLVLGVYKSLTVFYSMPGSGQATRGRGGDHPLPGVLFIFCYELSPQKISFNSGHFFMIWYFCSTVI